MSDWISVEERLPEVETDTLLVVVVRDEPLPISGESRFCDTDGFQDGKFSFWSQSEGSRVTHWQPLPEPPK